jgi:hypothetical protein
LSGENCIDKHVPGQPGQNHWPGTLFTNHVGCTILLCTIGGDACPRHLPGAFH